MERINQFGFYEIGRSFLAAKEATRPDAKVVSSFMPLFNAQTAARDLLSGKLIPLGVSRVSGEALLQSIDALVTSHFYSVDNNGNTEFNFPDENVTFLPWLVSPFHQSLGKFETVFAEELREAATYFVPRRGIFYTPALVDMADETFPSEVLPHIPEKARAEWKAAGRCIAFNVLSASGFHVARAVEGTLDLYYETFCGNPPAAGRSWGHLLSDLEKAMTPSPSAKTLSEIRQMKDDYRNPLMHPRVVLSEGDARMLFANGESLIIAMAQEIKAVAETTSGVQPSLALIQGGAGTS